MGKPVKRSTVYFAPEIHAALRLKAASTQCSISELVNLVVRDMLREDQADLSAFDERVSESTMSYEELLEELKHSGKI